MLGLLLVVAAGITSSPSIYGLEIGSVPSMLECELTLRPNKIPKASLTEILMAYKAPSTGSCWKRMKAQRSGAPLGDEIIHVQFPNTEKLAANSDQSVAVQLLKGRIAFVRFNTRGRSWQAEDLATFDEKFGKPTELKPVVLQNGFGARFDALEAVWILPEGVRAEFSSYGGFDEKGEFWIGTSDGKAAVEAPLKALLTPTVPL